MYMKYTQGQNDRGVHVYHDTGLYTGAYHRGNSMYPIKIVHSSFLLLTLLSKQLLISILGSNGHAFYRVLLEIVLNSHCSSLAHFYQVVKSPGWQNSYSQQGFEGNY